MISTVAWLYHMRGLRQSAIAERLNISQSKVSRLLEQAVDAGIVRTEVVLPPDEQSVLETELESAYGLRESHVYDIGRAPDESQLIHELGQLLALRMQSIASDAGVMGFTSWSRTLQEAVRQLRPLGQFSTQYVVEMVGDLGPPTFQHLAAQTTQQLADLTGGEPMFLRVPGVVASLEVKQTMLDHDKYARATLKKLDELDFALVGIGSGEINPSLRAGDNFFTAEQVAQAKRLGAVGEVDLRYIGYDGEPVPTDFDELIVGVTLEQLRRAGRRWGVAGGRSKYRAIRAALVGGWINTLVTDSVTAQWLLAHRG